MVETLGFPGMNYEKTGLEACNSGPMAQGGHISHTFTMIGECEYHCIPHPRMVGKVIVVA